MSENTGTPQSQVETTSVFRADLLKEMESGAAAAQDSAPSAENLPEDAALLVVKRGPNAGARFLLDQDCTTAGATPRRTSSSTMSRSPAATQSSAARRTPSR